MRTSNPRIVFFSHFTEDAHEARLQNHVLGRFLESYRLGFQTSSFYLKNDAILAVGKHLVVDWFITGKSTLMWACNKGNCINDRWSITLAFPY